jgi:hypothetical protein
LSSWATGFVCEQASVSLPEIETVSFVRVISHVLLETLATSLVVALTLLVSVNVITRLRPVLSVVLCVRHRSPICVRALARLDQLGSAVG